MMEEDLLDHVASPGVYLTYLKDFGDRNGVYGRYFPKTPPPWATVQARVSRDTLVERQHIVWISEGEMKA